MPSGYGLANVKDKHFVLSFSLADEQKVKRYIDRMVPMYGKPQHEDTYSDLANAIIDLVQKRHDDHKNYDAELGHDWLKVSPLNNPSFEEDMMTFQGLNKLLRIYAGLTTGTFRWLARGNAASTPHPYSTILASEPGSPNRLDAAVAGFHNVKGASIQLFAANPSTVPTTTIHQIGLFDASSGGTMLAIHDFAGASQVHTVNADSFALGMVLDFVPFGDI
jgi:hypothetical protein